MDNRAKPTHCFGVAINSFFRGVYNITSFVSSDRQASIIRITNFPVFSKKLANVYLMIPRDTMVTGAADETIFHSLEQAQIRLYQAELGSPYKHPHVFSGQNNAGTPCLHNKNISSARNLYIWFLQTITYQNISVETIKIGKPATRALGENSHEILRNVDAHKNFLREHLTDIMERKVNFIGNYFGNVFGGCLSR